ncbi:MAG: hypothetical protein IPL25_20310 [Saprospiraceae bacterium]|nr:hypothetical protein [Candidatus Vicinibacter affinis]
MILLDELNLAPTSVLEALAPLLYSQSEWLQTTSMSAPIRIPKRRLIVATMNPKTVKGNRKTLPGSILSMLTPVSLPVLQWSDLYIVAMSRVPSNTACTKHVLARLSQVLEDEQGKTMFISLRDALKVVELVHYLVSCYTENTPLDTHHIDAMLCAAVSAILPSAGQERSVKEIDVVLANVQKLFSLILVRSSADLLQERSNCIGCLQYPEKP